MRYFLAIELPEEVRSELIALQNSLKKLNLFTGSYVAPENLHVTLMFFGFLELKEHNLIKQTLNASIYEPCTLQLGTLEVPQWTPPRLLWVTTPSESLSAVYQRLREAFSQYAKKRSFVPHITLARIKKVPNPELLRTSLNQQTFTPLMWNASQLSLFASETDLHRPVYRIIEHFGLKK